MPAAPAFLITIDTEGDNAWARPRQITTQNSRFLPRFQALSEKYRLKPTWLTDYEMALCPVFQEFARDALARGACEIGMHLHAWTTPPFEPLTADDLQYQPFLAEYPETVLREKVRIMTDTLEQVIGGKMTSHRAGRWRLDSIYARVLAGQGYLADCSVTPGVSWKAHLGDPHGTGGSDYTGFPNLPYWLDLDRLDRPGDSCLLELPMTIVDPHPEWVVSARHRLGEGTFPRRVWQRLFPGPHWLRPNGSNRREMIAIVERAVRSGTPMVEFMLHSSEFMPEGSPNFRTAEAIERLFADLEALFETAGRGCRGATLTEFAREWPRPAKG